MYKSRKDCGNSSFPSPIRNGTHTEVCVNTIQESQGYRIYPFLFKNTRSGAHVTCVRISSCRGASCSGFCGLSGGVVWRRPPQPSTTRPLASWGSCGGGGRGRVDEGWGQNRDIIRELITSELMTIGSPPSDKDLCCHRR